MAWVLDASVTTTWCFQEERRPDTDRLLDRLREEPAVVPSLWRLEVVNVLLAARRRARLTEATATRFLRLLDRLPIVVDEEEPDLETLLSAGWQHTLSAYDAAYLLTAKRHGAALATLDQQLASAATAAAVPLVLSGSGD